MQFEISAPKRFSGETGLPGDRLLTIGVLAFAAVGGKPVELRGISTAPDAAALLHFLRDAGVFLSGEGDAVVVWGAGFRETLTVPVEVPIEALHIIIPAAVFSTERVTVECLDDNRSDLVRSLFPVLHSLGLPESAVRKSGAGWEIGGARLRAPKLIEIVSPRELEAAAAATLAAGASAKVAFARTEAGPALPLLRSLGLRAEGPEPPAETSALARRLAKLSGDRNRETLTLDWDFQGRALEIPGDTTLAAALAGAAALIPRSDVLLRGVLWEPGRRGFFEALKRMRANVEWTTRRGAAFDTADLRIRGAILEGIRTTPAQARSMTGELPLLAAISAFARGETIIREAGSGTGIGSETRRALALALESLGAHIGDYPDGIVVKGGSELRGNLTDAAENPAVALALALAGQAAAGTTVVFGYDGDAYPVGPYLKIAAKLGEYVKPTRDTV